MHNSELGLVIIVILVIVAIWIWSRCQLNCNLDERYRGIGKVSPTHVVHSKQYEDEDEDEDAVLKGWKYPDPKICPAGCFYDSCICKCRAIHPYAHLKYPKPSVKASIPGSTLASFGVGQTPDDVKTDVVIY
jgi:hypothetical protein